MVKGVVARAGRGLVVVALALGVAAPVTVAPAAAQGLSLGAAGGNSRLSQFRRQTRLMDSRLAAQYQQSARYQPLAGGMAAALPYVDVFTSGHSLDALDDVLTAISAD